MSTYDMKCNDCGKEAEVVCKMSELDDEKLVPCDECGGQRSVVITAGSIHFGDPVTLGIRKPDSGFQEVLSKIHNNTAGSNLNLKLSRN